MTSPVADPGCPRCQGSGWVKVADAGAGAATPCECRKARRVPALLAAAQIPPRYLDCTFQSFEVDSNSVEGRELLRARVRCTSYVEEFFSLERGSTSERGLLLSGPPGVGKTHLAVATLKELIRRYGAGGRFLDFSSFLAEIQATFDPTSRESKHRLLDPVIATDVLLFDELGAAQSTPFVRDILYLIVNGRYSAKRATIFTTNFLVFSPKGAPKPALPEDPLPFDLSAQSPSKHDLLAERVSPMLLSRVLEMARPVPIRASDYRKTKIQLSHSQ